MNTPDNPKGEESRSCDMELPLAQPEKLNGKASEIFDQVGESQYPMRQTSVTLPLFKDPITFNATVSVIALSVLWGLSLYCTASPEVASASLSQWFDNVVDMFTWFYIVANPVLTFFIIWIAIRYGDIKLGTKDAEPEFSNASYFAMIFSAGVGVGLFFFGVSEPLWHSEPGNYYSNAGYHSQNEIDQWSLVITMYHWGFAAWSPYLVVAIASGLGCYRYGLPLTIRSTFYPIIGDYCWGWIGDLIDSYSIVMTIAGVCTSLGLGAIQLVAGLQRLGWADPEKEDLQAEYQIIVWCLTGIASISVLTGLSIGIKILANIAFSLGCLVLFLCFVMEKTNFLLNLLVQTTGIYMQYNIFQVPFWTDAFGSLKENEGRAVDGNSSAEWFIGAWTVFYMAWWVAWACFVGMFIARISKNRSLRQVIVSVFLCPTIYCLIWFSFMGGIGLRQERQALELRRIGNDIFEDPNYFASEDSNFCLDVPQEDVLVNGTVVFTNRLPGITPVCTFDTSNSEQAWFNVMYSFSYPDVSNFGGFGPFLSGLSIITLAIYFVTSSDSGSMIVDVLASNGSAEHHWLQRLFWAITEGAVASALLIAGGSKALRALQSASIVFGLPFNLFLFVMCSTIVGMCNQIEAEQREGMIDPCVLRPMKSQSWTMPLFGGIFNVCEFIFSLGFVHEKRKEKGMDLPTFEYTLEFFKALAIPFLPMYKIYSSAIIDPKQTRSTSNAFVTAIFASCFFGWVVLFCFGAVNHGFVALAWSLFFVNVCILTVLRMEFRSSLGIQGNFVGDIVASSFLYPQALAQMVVELKSDKALLHATSNHDE